jgi:hypothetical protein
VALQRNRHGFEGFGPRVSSFGRDTESRMGIAAAKPLIPVANICFLMNETGDQKLEDLPPSAKLVFTVIDHEEPLTQKQIAEKSRLSERTTRYALGRLKGVNAINEEMNFMDARQMLYTTARTISSTGDLVGEGDTCRS